MKEKILVVDDDRVYRSHLSELLNDAGYFTEATLGTPDLLDQISKDGTPRLVVLDPMIGRTDGFRFMEELKRKEPSLDILVVSSQKEPESIIKAFRCGAGDYVVKPFNPDELILSVTRLLGVKALFHESRPFHEAIRLYDACRNLSACLDMDRLKGFVLEVSTGLLQTDLGFVVLSDEEGKEAEVLTSHGISPEEAEGWVKPLRKCSLSTFAGTPKLLKVLLEGEGEQAGEKGRVDPSRALVLPLAFDEAGWGAVVVARDSEREGYSEDELANARFLARQTLISFQNAMTFESVHELNYIDDMTGLYNHRYLELTLEREIHKAQVKEGTFAVLFIDIDHFKRINDTFGHPVGRLVLVELGKVLKNSVREMDVVARYGGDEFVVVTRLPPNMANKVARRILEQLRGHVFLGREGKKIKLTASIGLALYPEHATSTKDLVELADKAMYEGKKVGRDTVYLASDLTSDSKD